MGGRDLQIPVNIESVILAGEDDRTVIHKSDVEALRVFDFRLVGGDELALLGEQRKVEVVVVVRYEHLALAVDAHADRVVGDALAADLPKVLALVIEDLRRDGALVC